LFVHRNIANLVPPYTPDGKHHGTGAALEFAVTALKVEHILVMGHSQCGGVRGCIEMCRGEAPATGGRWKPRRAAGWTSCGPAYARVADLEREEDRQTALEKEGIHLSLENLLGYPFVAEAVDAGRLTLHGLWTDIAEMNLETFDGTVRHFVQTGAS
jgi:carbonic anhydrase